MPEKYNVLYVDDEQGNLRSFRLVFRKKYNVLIAQNAEEALELMRSNDVHLVITDQRMPDVTGVEFLKMIKPDYPDIKYILLTGYSDHEALKEAINEVGIFWYVNKPFENEEMEQLIDRAITAHENQVVREQTEKRLDRILNSARDSIIAIDRHETITMVNPATCRLFDLDEEALLGKHLSEVVPDLLAQTDEDSESENGGAPTMSARPIQIKKKDGSLVPVDIVMSSMELDGQEHHTLFIRDISEKIKTEEQIRDQRERLALATSAARIGIWDWNVKKDYLVWEDSMFSIFGLSKNDFKEAFEDWSNLLHEDDKEFVSKEVELALSGSQDFDTEFRIRWPDGSVRHIRAVAKVYRNVEGEGIRMVGANWDITEMKGMELKVKESEAKFRGVFESMVDVFFRVNNDGIYEMVSPSVYNVLGFKPEELIGTAAENYYVNPEDRNQLKQALKNEGFCNNLVLEVYNKKKEKIFVSVNAREYTDENGNVAGLESMVRDITEVKQAENQIRQMNEELESKVQERTLELESANAELKKAENDILEALSKEKELGELKSRFVATASHQFRTPLTVIQSNVDLLEMYLDKLDEDLKRKFVKSFGRIHKESSRMTDLMNDVLILGKINAGATEANLREIDALGILTDLVESMNQVDKYDAKVRMEVRERSKKIMADEKQFTHIVQNILSNAQKYSLDRGDVDFVVDFQEQGLELTVRDKGIGMSEEDRKNLFQPFFRGKNAQDIQGTGLGLSIVHEYVKLNEGEINVQSELDKGTTVKMSFNYPK